MLLGLTLRAIVFFSLEERIPSKLSCSFWVQPINRLHIVDIGNRSSIRVIQPSLFSQNLEQLYRTMAESQVYGQGSFCPGTVASRGAVNFSFCENERDAVRFLTCSGEKAGMRRLFRPSVLCLRNPLTENRPAQGVTRLRRRQPARGW